MDKALRKVALAAWVGIATAAAAPPALAAGWAAVLARGPVQDYNDEDLRMLLDAIRQTLDAPGDPQPVTWRNDKSGAGGTLLVVGRPKADGFDECRRVRATLHSRRRQATTAVWTACQEPGGRWVLVTAG
jgi:surface antigen